MPLQFDQLATREDVDSVIAAALRFCKIRENYDQLRSGIHGYGSIAPLPVRGRGSRRGVILDDEAVMARLRSMPNIRQMDWTECCAA